MEKEPNNQNKQTEQSKEENTLDMNGIWKAAATLLKDDTLQNAISTMKQLDFQDNQLNLSEKLKQYAEKTTERINELTQQVNDMNGQMEELKQRIEEFKRQYSDKKTE